MATRTHTVELGQLGAVYRAEQATHLEALERALYRAALLAEPIVAEATPVDQGNARNAWATRRTDGGAELFNDSPYIGILEEGRRPGKPPPIMPILRWVVRKWGLNLDGGRRSFERLEDVPWPTYHAAKTIQMNIAEKGTEPNHMVRGNLPKMGRLAKQESERALAHARALSSSSSDVPF